MAKLLIYIGIFLLVLGVALAYAPWTLSWFGRLPGDVRIEKENSFVFIPITSMLVISAVITIFINLFIRR